MTPADDNGVTLGEVVRRLDSLEQTVRASMTTGLSREAYSIAHQAALDRIAKLESVADQRATEGRAAQRAAWMALAGVVLTNIADLLMR